MMLNKDLIRDSDWETMFIRDPSTFVTNILLSFKYSDPRYEKQELERLQFVFSKWLQFHSEEYKRSIKIAETRGYIQALSTLPLKKSLGRERVDLKQVTIQLKSFKEIL